MAYFFAALALSVLLTVIVRKIALKKQIIDYPDHHRKLHNRPVPLLGGWAIFLAFWLMTGYLIFFTNVLGHNLQPQRLIGVFIGSLILMILGYFDDKKNLSPKIRLAVSALAVIIAIAGGVGLDKITNPFGGIISLAGWQVQLGCFGTFSILSSLIVFIWLLGMMYTTKISDGLDGLSTGIVLIGALMIFFLSRTGKFFQPDVAVVALILAGACLGFLFFNFYPAKIFLGEGGGLFLGFILGVLAIIAGGKIATALLVMAIPMLDFIRVIYLRFKIKQPLLKGDRRHLHYQLLDLGLGHRQTVLILYAISFAFGLTTLFLQSREKMFVLLILAVLMTLTGIWLGRQEELKKIKN